MNYTSNYNLNKPERNEQFNLDHWNDNSDTIDTAMNTNKVNIATNKSSIDTILTGLSTKNVSDTSSIYYKLMKLIYPVGSIYWSSNRTNPANLFGGTWVQIKDKFVLACGDTYKTAGATGGNASITLTEAQMPSHSHSFSGTTGLMNSKKKHSHHSGAPMNYTESDLSLYGVVVTSDVTKVFSVSSNKYNMVSPLTNEVDIDHTHTYSGTTSVKGSNSSIGIMPPYIVKYCWERTA